MSEMTIKAYDEEADITEFNENVGTAHEPSSEDGEEAPHQGSSPRKLDAADYHSWGCFGNDQFVASSKTTDRLPPGVYRISMNNNGQLVFMKQKLVTDNLFKLADSVSLKVLASIGKFWESKERFKKFGMIFKRGIILFGPAGAGKTVTVTLLTEQIIERGGIVVMCERPDWCSSALQTIRRIEADRQIINVIEDIDTIIENWGEQSVLPMLDGENQVDNIVHVATTNYPERLDARLVNRPSRFDEIRKVDMPKDNIRRDYIKSVLEGKGDLEEQVLEKWVKDTQGMSLAHLRELVVAVFCLEREYEPTIARLRAMTKAKPKSNGNGSSGFKAASRDDEPESIYEQ